MLCKRLEGQFSALCTFKARESGDGTRPAGCRGLHDAPDIEVPAPGRSVQPVHYPQGSV